MIASDVTRDLIPRADDAEMALVGSMFWSEVARDEVLSLVTDKDFFDGRCAVLFRALRDMHEAAKPIDAVLVYDHLRERKLLNAEINPAFISDAFQSVPNAAHAVYYAQKVSSAAILRSVMDAGDRMARDAVDNQGDPQGVLQRAENALSSLLDRSIRKDPVDLSSVLSSALSAIEQRMNDGVDAAAISTGMGEVDAILAGGLRRKQLAILAARPGVGKTAFATQIAVHAALNDCPTLFISLEMGKDELGERVLSQASRVDGARMRNGTLSREDRQAISEAAAKLSTAELWIEDRGELSYREVCAMARRAKRRGRLELLIVDYLQLMQAPNARVPRQEQVADLSRGLKLLAKDLDVPILCLCQMNRDAEKHGRAPKLSDLRESGAIEQDADVVMFLHKEDSPNGVEGGAVEVMLQVEKQRSGPRAKLPILWHKKHCSFVEKAAERFTEFDNYNGADPFGDV